MSYIKEVVVWEGAPQVRGADVERMKARENMMKNILMMVVALQASLAMASYVTFLGQNSDSNAPIGSLVTAANWLGGTLPSGSSTGLVYTTSNVWTGNAWNNLAVRQTGGYVNGGTQVNLRGGTSGSGITTVYEIEDSRTDYASYTNLYVNGNLTLFSQYGEAMELSILSGHVEAATNSWNAAGKGVVNMRDGLYHAASMINGKSTVNMLAGGTGQIVVDSLDTSLNGGLYLNFETGNRGSFKFGQKTGGVSAGGTWQYLISHNQISIDGVVETNESKYIISNSGLGTTLSLNPYADYVVFIGQNNSPAAPVGALNVASNWFGYVLPSGSSTGLVSATPNVWAGTAWNNLAVKQVGGYVFAAGGGSFALRGGTTNSGITTVYEIEDSRTDYATYTNLNVGNVFSLWSQYGEKMDLSLLSGHVEAAVLSLAAAGKGAINMRDGLLHAGALGVNAAATVNMLAGGDGTIVVDDMNGFNVTNLYVNFETGNLGSLTFGMASNGVSAAGTWESLVTSGRVMIDGVTDTRTYKYSVTQNSLASTIALGGAVIPSAAYASWAAGYGLTDTNGTGAATADPDGDAIDNLAEYGMGGNPADGNDQGHVPTSAMTAAGGTNWLQYVYYERADKAVVGLSYYPERGTDLVVTNWATSGIEFVGTGVLDVDFNTVTNRIPTTSENKQFLRLRVELQD